MDAVTTIPEPVNEPVRQYAPGSTERAELEGTLKRMQSDTYELTMTIGGERRMAAGEPIEVVQPHNHRHVLGTMGSAGADDAQAAIDAARAAAPGWRAMSFDDRAAILLKAADLLAGPWRSTLNAATMLGQSKTAIQAEIDSACELIDFWRFNVGLRPADLRRAAQVRPRCVEPRGPSAARRLRLRDHAVQLHRDRRQPADRPGPDGQRRHLEARADPAGRRPPAS